MCDGHSQYAVIEFSGRVLVPDAGTCYEAACEISRSVPVENGHGVVNLSWEYQFGMIGGRAVPWRGMAS
jgi:hypothetical protein